MNTLTAILEDSARRFPERTAVTMRIGVRSITYSYSALEQRARRVATRLRAEGVQPGDRIVIWSVNQPDWVAALFGAFYAGAIVVPLDVNCARDFVERVVGQTEPRLALATERLGGVLRELGVRTIAFETLEVPPEPDADLPAVTPDVVAEVIFTSGTTGDPKGVMLTQRNIASNVAAILQAIPLPGDARMLSLLPLSHMFEQVGGCFCPLAVGAAIRYPSTRQPSALAAIMREWRPTAMAGVPQLLAVIMAGIEREATAHGRTALLERLRRIAMRLPRSGRRLLFRPVLQQLGGALDFVITGGAAVAPELQAKWEAIGVDVLEGYGATECSPVITSNALGHGRPGSVGKALPTQEVRLAADGEVLTRGANVFASYWHNEAATVSAFDNGWYRTGDLGQFDADGYLFLRGRKKDLIVLADGQNVYPEDVESALSHQPGVLEAVVVGVPRDDTIRITAAMLESIPGSAAEAVRRANAVLDGRQQILDFAVWPELDFPRTHTLKVRRPLVQAYFEEQARPAPSAPAMPADTDPLVRLIAEANAGQPPLNDAQALGDDIGLDSLSRVELLSAIEDALGVYIDDTAVGPHTTVAELRSLVSQQQPRPPTRRPPEWSRRWPATAIRRYALQGVVNPALGLFYDVEVRGVEHALAAPSPSLIVSNHILHLDAALLMCNFPTTLRARVAIAAAVTDVFGASRWRAFGVALLGNAFPFSKDGSGVRDSLEYLAKTLEGGWSVLIFPEGMLTVLGPMQPFKSGTGLLAVEARVPVLPMRLDVLHEGSLDRGHWLPPRRGHVRISFGAPLSLPPDLPYAEATTRLEQAVRDI